MSKIGAVIRTFLAGKAGQGALKKDPTILLDGARPHP